MPLVGEVSRVEEISLLLGGPSAAGVGVGSIPEGAQPAPAMEAAGQVRANHVSGEAQTLTGFAGCANKTLTSRPVALREPLARGSPEARIRVLGIAVSAKEQRGLDISCIHGKGALLALVDRASR